MQLIDTQCHLDLPIFDADRKQVLEACHSAGVTDIVLTGIQQSTWQPLINLCAGHDPLHLALGLHPMFIEAHNNTDLILLAEQLKMNQAIAIGEIGLDFYDKTADKEAQIALFRSQLEIAADLTLPVILHVRKAHDQVLQLLQEIPISGGICHAFNGSIQQAHKYIELGFKLGFGGMLTYDRSSKLRDLAKSLPLSALVLETDAPDMSPVKHRGKRNSPAYLPEIAAVMAAIREVPIEKIASQTALNAKQVLPLLP